MLKYAQAPLASVYPFPTQWHSQVTILLLDTVYKTRFIYPDQHAHETGHYPIWNEVKLIDRDPHWYTRRVKKAIHIIFHPNNINIDSGIEIPKAWMPTIKKHSNKRTAQQRTAEGTATRRNNGTMRGSKCTNHSRPS